MLDTLDQNIELDTDKLKINNSIKQNLLTAGKWARFLAIVGFIFTGLTGVVALISLVTALSTGFAPLIGLAFFYVAMTVVMIFPALYMVRFAGSITKGLNSNKQGEFDYGVENLKSFFKFSGIFTIVFLGLYILLIFIGASMGSGLSRMF
ncbi:hypothetical protein [Fluviicola taffensis]|uniref:DUF5362 domain-containing protein n=1 Tax=Fluviicola taffensis (strain DSM 16823 / NCIMB 13979 / RW262) TaxID=755732 RepID=F2IBR7_FLUTR|nr:hypothetical protein [Fluviicola taffensis]AEA45393.1 hypothetical protein Fluta_3421 [Fluviicola taffensis DSM 16823]